MQFSYDPSLQDACLSATNLHVWFFDSGSSRHITSQRGMFSSLESALVGCTIMCANNSSYPVKGVGKFFLVVTNGSTFTPLDALYVPGIKKNLLSVFALAKNVLVVNFVDDRCTIHDLIDGDVIVTSGSLCLGLYRLDSYEKSLNDATYSIFDV